MLNHYEIRWKLTWRGKKKHKSDHFRVENYMVRKIRRQEQFFFTIPPTLGWHEAFPVPQRPDSSWGIMAPLTTADGLLCQPLPVVLGLSYTPDQQPGLPQPPVEVSMAPFHWRFLKLEISQTTLKPFLKSCNLISCMILGWCKPKGSKNQTTHSQEALRLNCTGWGLKDTLF